jgi:energy-coupling factor transport system substrate-specific component
MENKLNVKDLINVGIFTAIYFVVFYVSGMVGYIPVFMVLLPFLLPLMTGIPFMLFLTKVNKFGMVSIMGIIVSIIMAITGHGWPVIAVGVPCAVIADLLFKSGEYKSWWKIVAGFCIFSEWIMGAMLPFWIMRDAYFAQIRAGYGDEYTNTLMSLMSGWMFAVMALLVIVGGTVGAYIGRGVLKKHFKRSGIA